MPPRLPRFILALFVAGTTLAASFPGMADSPRQPAITEVRADGAVLHVFGLNLGGGRPKVTLGTHQLSVVSATAGQIDAMIPAGVSPGSYLLTVTVGRNKDNDRSDDDGKYDEFWVAIGAAGPQGPVGAPGPQGPVGAQGSQGPAGAPGPQGPAGPAAKDGATGLQGPAGPMGAAGPQGATGPMGNQGPPGLPGKEGPAGPSGREGPAGPSGKDGATGPAGPQGPAGSGGSLSTIESLAGLPCTVALCPGSTAVAFDPLTSGLRLTCVRVPGSITLRIQGAAGVGAKLPAKTDRLAFTSDVPGFSGEIEFRNEQNAPVAFDIPVSTLCAGQPVSVTLTRFGSFGVTPLLAQGGSCALVPLGDLRDLSGQASVTCNFTMNGNQTLTIQ